MRERIESIVVQLGRCGGERKGYILPGLHPAAMIFDFLHAQSANGYHAKYLAKGSKKGPLHQTITTPSGTPVFAEVTDAQALELTH